MFVFFRRAKASAFVLALAALAALAGFGVAARAETIVVGPDRPGAFAEALDRAKDGDQIVLLSGTYKGLTGVIAQKKLTITGRGKRPVLQYDGKVAEDKAMLVVKDGHVRLENLEFRGARASDGNGAGVRFEKGRLEVVRCAFFENQNGLLTANFEDAQLEIEASEFARSPKEVGGLNHLLYVGRIASLRLQGSRFHTGFEGHLVKSRARTNVIAYNMIRDGSEGEASYEIDLPNGGNATIIGNVVSQSPRSQNPVLISYGAEGKAWDDNALVLAHNTLISEGWRPGWFLRVHRDRVPGMREVLALNNLVVGGGLFELGARGTFIGNRPATLGMLADVVTGAFELPPDSLWRGQVRDPRQAVAGRNLAPTAEFEWPAGTVPIPADRARWAPGAYQR
jgi:hypothetical protein